MQYVITLTITTSTIIVNCKCTKFDACSPQKVIYKTKLYNCKNHFIKALHMDHMVHVLLNALNA